MSFAKTVATLNSVGRDRRGAPTSPSPAGGKSPSWHPTQSSALVTVPNVAVIISALGRCCQETVKHARGHPAEVVGVAMLEMDFHPLGCRIVSDRRDCRRSDGDHVHSDSGMGMGMGMGEIDEDTEQDRRKQHADVVEKILADEEEKVNSEDIGF